MNNYSEKIKKDNRSIGKFFSRESILGLFVLALFIILFVSTNFSSRAGIDGFLKEVSYMLIASTAMTMIIITGNIDISAGTMMGLCGYAAAFFAKMGFGFYVFIPVAIITGVFFAGINGFIITKFKVPALVATLAMVNVHLGLFILLPGGGWVENLQENFTLLGEISFFRFIPLIFLISLAIFIFLLYFMKYSRFSKKIYAVGGNKDAAILAGIKPDSVIMKAYLIEGLLIGITAIFFYTTKNVVQANSTYGIEFLFITAAVVGGTSIMGGKGKLIGTGFGVILVMLILRAMIFFGFQDYTSYVLQGIIILIAVLFMYINLNKIKNFFRPRDLKGTPNGQNEKRGGK